MHDDVMICFVYYHLRSECLFRDFISMVCDDGNVQECYIPVKDRFYNIALGTVI